MRKCSDITYAIVYATTCARYVNFIIILRYDLRSNILLLTRNHLMKCYFISSMRIPNAQFSVVVVASLILRLQLLIEYTCPHANKFASIVLSNNQFSSFGINALSC